MLKTDSGMLKTECLLTKKCLALVVTETYVRDMTTKFAQNYTVCIGALIECLAAAMKKSFKIGNILGEKYWQIFMSKNKDLRHWPNSLVNGCMFPKTNLKSMVHAFVIFNRQAP